MNEWQPIETAPKDGTYFLAHWPKDEIDPHKPRYFVCHYAFNCIWPSWITPDDMPTHWQHLPAPPKMEDE